MARLFILIFAFNAFFTPASAMGVCEMMDESDMASMTMSSTMPSSSMMSAMVEMECCGMDADKACDSSQCASSVVPSLLFSENHTPLFVADHRKPGEAFAYFYQIILPINTPPPLV